MADYFRAHGLRAVALGLGDRSLSQRLEQVLDHLEASFRAFRLRLGQRPRATAMHRMGFDPACNGRGGWCIFVRDMGDPVEAQALTTVGDLLRRIDRDRALTRPAVNARLGLTQRGAVEEVGLAQRAHDPLLARVGRRLAPATGLRASCDWTSG